MPSPTPNRTLRCAITAITAVAAIASGTTHIVLVLTGYPVKPGTFGFLATVTAVGTLGFLMQLAAGWILDRFDQMEAKQDERDVLVDDESVAAARRLNVRLLSGQN